MIICAKPGNYYADVSGKLLRRRSNQKVGLVLLPWVQEEDLTVQMQSVDTDFMEILKVAERLANLGDTLDKSSELIEFVAVLSSLEEASDLFEKLSQADQRYFKRLRVPEIVSSMRKLTQLPIWDADLV